jgi:hypothetical protein
MKPNATLLPMLIAALLAGRAWCGEGAEAPAKTATGGNQASSAKQDYDAIFSDILKSLPQEKRALVDSAHAKGNSASASDPADPGKGQPTEEEKDKARKDAAAKRSKALEALPPEVKARVDKAISDLDNRRKEKQAELKELDK